MKVRCVLFTAVIILLGLDRLPAPIVEEEKPTPAAEQPEAPRRKRSTRSTATEQTSAPARAKATPEPASQGPARFAGTWNGKVNQGLLGHVQTSVTVDPTATSVELSHNLGGGTRSLTTSGNTISWKTGVVGEVAWSLTPNSDGQTAEVTMKGLLLNDSATFRRGQASAASFTTTPASPSQTRQVSTTETSSAAGGSLTGPRPKYSQAARDAHLTGTGTYLLHFDTATGSVADVTVTQSTGSAALDQAAIEAFRQWHEQPNGKKEFPLTISFP